MYKHPLTILIVLHGLLAAVFLAGARASLGRTEITPRVTLATASIQDQDDMCVWIHPSDPSLSTIVASDKSANKLFVYDLDGNAIQTLDVPGQPGNVDIRYGFPLSGNLEDIVAYNDRDQSRIVVLRVDATTRQLSRIDDGTLATGRNYGFCLYRSPITGRFHAFTAAKSGAIEQWELSEAAGAVTGTRVRSWSLSSQTEGCVCDDETSQAYFGEENEGIWKIAAEPGDPTIGTLIASVGGPGGLTADVEGLSIYYAADGEGYLLASSQGSDDFRVFQRRPPHALVKSFRVIGANSTDGIDVTNVALGGTFSSGIFTLHNGSSSPYPVEVCAWEDLDLIVDTDYWDPRGPGSVAVDAVSWGRTKAGYR